MLPPRPSPFVLAPNLVLYAEEELYGPRLKRLARMIPVRLGEPRPPGEALPAGIRRTVPLGPAGPGREKDWTPRRG
ncbi:hypothetical protein METESE_17000 [Mesoterricola sediminis]|uniref:Uncharacterized protein n=1 Tax=Mesoterricola sediminis TaxID=2927980 RepID=A0AA48GZ71_9BACT|nr:hypothetical protein METESE_17000 [Mesoterricola sediminis]